MGRVFAAYHLCTTTGLRPGYTVTDDQVIARCGWNITSLQLDNLDNKTNDMNSHSECGLLQYLELILSVSYSTNCMSQHL